MAKNVKQRDGQLLGLLVHEVHALKFLASPTERKVYEIRSRPVHFLAEGESIALISVAPCGWSVIAILEFQACLKIKLQLFDRHFPLHRVSKEEAKTLLGHLEEKQDHCWGWHFEMVHAFNPPLVFGERIPGPQQWVYFPVSKLEGVECEAHEVNLSQLPQKRPSSESTRSAKKSKGSTLSAASSQSGNLVLAEQDSQKTEVMVDPIEETREVNDDNVTCIVLREEEWSGLCRGGLHIYKPNRAVQEELYVCVQRKNVLYFGIAEFAGSNSVDLKGAWPEWANNMYSTYHLKHFKSLKRLFHWNLKSIDMVEEESEVRPLRPKHSGHQPFRRPTSDFKYTPARPPANLCLKETARYFMETSGDSYIRPLLENLRSLKGKTIRVGTACSGTDICVTVLKQTLEFFNEQEAGEPQPRVPAVVYTLHPISYIYIYIFVFSRHRGGQAARNTRENPLFAGSQHIHPAYIFRRE